MCLPMNGRQTIKKAPRNVYKVYKLSEGENSLNLQSNFSDREEGLVVRPPVMDTRFIIHQDKFIISDRRHKKLTAEEKSTKRIAQGIHVYLEKKNALKYISTRNYRYIIVECEARAEDFIAQCDEKSYIEHKRAVYHKILPRKIVAFKDESISSTIKEYL